MCNNGDTGNSHMSNRSHEVLPLNEKVKVLYLLRVQKLYTEVANIYNNNQSSIHRITFITLN